MNKIVERIQRRGEASIKQRKLAEAVTGSNLLHFSSQFGVPTNCKLVVSFAKATFELTVFCRLSCWATNTSSERNDFAVRKNSLIVPSHSVNKAIACLRGVTNVQVPVCRAFCCVSVVEINYLNICFLPLNLDEQQPLIGGLLSPQRHLSLLSKQSRTQLVSRIAVQSCCVAQSFAFTAK